MVNPRLDAEQAPQTQPNKSGRKPSGLEQNRPDLNRANQPTEQPAKEPVQPGKANGEYVKPGRETDESQVP